jgi:2-hydroxychromene-2-carboxylate isomerase
VRVDDGDALVARQEVKDELRANGEAALAAGVFGVPTLVIDERIFWGYDATAMAHDYLAHPERFHSDEMKRVADLPVGKSRP